MNQCAPENIKTIASMMQYNIDGRIIVICGATATGKSRLAFELAKKINGIIINADSAQIYKEIPIITAQPTAEMRAEVEHRLYGIVSCYEKDQCKRHNVADWIAAATSEIDGILACNATPIIVGGTGLYVSSLIEGLVEIPVISEYTKLELKNLKTGKVDLYEVLKKYDPELAARLEYNDMQRILRGIEVFLETKIPLSEWQKEHHKIFYPSKQFFTIFVNPERRLIYKNIHDRFDIMLESGVLEEVANVMPYCNLNHVKPIGFREIANYISGKIEKNDMISQVKQRTRNYAKKQITWFRRKMRYIDIDLQN